MGLRQRSYLVEWGGTHVNVKELPPALQKALKTLGYRRRDIEVVGATEAQMGYAGGKGRRGVSASVNLRTGQMSQVAGGSWGGPNPFERKPMDDLEAVTRVPPDGAIIKGSEGGHGTWFTIYVHPDSLIKMLPGKADISERETHILAMMNFKSDYKKRLLRKNNVTKEEIDKLASEGYIKVNKAGAISLTAKGKNAKAARLPYGMESGL
jgi:hypothetical protein